MAKWNQSQVGNAHVSDGCMGYWAEYPVGTAAIDVLNDFLSTADYSASTADFVVRAEIDGNVSSRTVRAGGYVG